MAHIRHLFTRQALFSKNIGCDIKSKWKTQGNVIYSRVWVKREGHPCLTKEEEYHKTTQTWATFTDGGPPFSPATWPAPSSALLSTAQADVKIGWATKTINFEDVRGYKMTPLVICKWYSQTYVSEWEV